VVHGILKGSGAHAKKKKIGKRAFEQTADWSAVEPQWDELIKRYGEKGSGRFGGVRREGFCRQGVSSRGLERLSGGD